MTIEFEDSPEFIPELTAKQLLEKADASRDCISSEMNSVHIIEPQEGGDGTKLVLTSYDNSGRKDSLFVRHESDLDEDPVASILTFAKQHLKNNDLAYEDFWQSVLDEIGISDTDVLEQEKSMNNPFLLLTFQARLEAIFKVAEEDRTFGPELQNRIRDLMNLRDSITDDQSQDDEPDREDGLAIEHTVEENDPVWTDICRAPA